MSSRWGVIRAIARVADVTAARALAAGVSTAAFAAVPIAAETQSSAATTRSTLVASAELVARANIARGNIGATPQLAISRDFDDARAPRVRIRRTNVVGRFATVSSRGALIEAEPLRDAILLEHFSFGWQPLEVLDDPCRLRGQVTSVGVRDRLMRGMPATHTSGVCNVRAVRDSGPRRDVDALRRRMDEPLVPYVAVKDTFAVASWYGGGGGISLWKRHGTDRKLVTHGGGSLGVAEMRRFGVPRDAWCAFGISGARRPNDASTHARTSNAGRS